MSSTLMRVVQSLIIGATLVAAVAALAATESSCPAPCAKPPKSALFLRQTGNVDANGYTGYVTGSLRKGTAKTLLRIDATVNVQLAAPMNRLAIDVDVNGYSVPGVGLYANACDQATSINCSVTATGWWDIDALEAAHPGAFLGKPLNIVVAAGTFFGFGGTGSPYTLSVSAQIVQNK